MDQYLQYVTQFLNRFWLEFILSNFALAMFALALIFIIFHRLIRGRNISFSEIVFRWTSLFALGFTGVYAFIMHIFFSQMTAHNIGWTSSPFQFEVGVADLAFGVLGIIAFKASFGFRAATAIGAAIWLWGDAVGHIIQVIQSQNFAPGNSGSWLWMDILVPLILLICVSKLKPGELMVV